MNSDSMYLRRHENGCRPLRPVEITEVFTMFLRICQEPFFFGGELHDPWELVYIRRGEATITSDDKVYQLSSGSLIFHKPMEFHQILAENAGLELFVTSFHMTGDLAYRLRNGVFQLLPAEQALFEQLIADCVSLNQGYCADRNDWNCKPLWQADPLAFYNCVHQLERIFSLLLTRSPDTQHPKDTENSMLYRQIVGILEEHIYTDITIEEVSRLCGVSPSTVKACFARHAGCGLHKYFLKIKIRTAIRLLKEGRSVSEVSNLLSFNNPNYFSYVFRRETGKRPSDYK